MTVQHDELAQRRIDKNRAAQVSVGQAARDLAATFGAAARALVALGEAWRASHDRNR